MSRVPVVAAPAGRQHGPHHLHFGRYRPALSSPSHVRAAKDQIVASLYQWGTVMRAVRFETGGVVKIVQIPDPRPGPEEVLVQVHAAGVCRTDLHLLDQVKASERKPLVPGHEIAGRVSKIGAVVDLGHADEADLGAVIGAGGVGLSAIQIARVQGARVLAVDPREEARKAALDSGAQSAAPPQEAESAAKDLAANEGVDLVIDLVGTDRKSVV